MNKKVAFLDSLAYSKNGIYNHRLYKDRLVRIDIYKNLDYILNFDVIILPSFSDEIWLKRHKSLLDDFLQSKKILINFCAFCDDVIGKNYIYTPSETAIKDRIIKIIDQNFFKGIAEYDINHRRGIKGFFNRGYSNLPENAHLLLNDNDDKAVAFYFKNQFDCIILHTNGADFLEFGNFDTDTSRLLGKRLFDFIDIDRENL